jgi:L-rhamnose mutarotase
MRICFLLQVRPDKLQVYKQRHAQVWPEMKEALRKAGWRNYSLFLNPEGLLVGYLETEDFDKAREAMKKMPVNARWQEEMTSLVAALNTGYVDDNMFPLEEVFHLD